VIATFVDSKGGGHGRFKIPYICHCDAPPSSLLNPKKGPTLFKSGGSWNLVPLPASNIRGGGEKGVLKAPGLD